jgi:phosphoglycolate phosphatase-like HAD superfamily hydrolase
MSAEGNTVNRTLLLFDIDGTLLLTGGAGMRAMRTVASRLYHPEFRWDGISPGGHLDPLIFAEAAALNRIDGGDDEHRRFHDHYIEQLRAELESGRQDVRVMPGIHDLLVQLRHREMERQDITLGLLTGNYARAVPLKLAAIDVDPDWFSITAFGDEATTRPGLVALAMQRYEALMVEPSDSRRVVIIGDTPRDVACARAHGCIAFAVATGVATYDELQAAHPDHLVPDFSDPRPLFELLDRLAMGGEAPTGRPA